MAEKPRKIETKSLTEIEETVESHVDRLATLERITEDDLNEFRRALPIDPMLSEVVQRVLPYPWSELFEYVEESEHRPAHWRTSHDRSAIRSKADLEHKRRFAQAAREARGMEGTVEHDGKEIPASAAHVAEKVSGQSVTSNGPVAPGRRALRRLRELLGG